MAVTYFKNQQNFQKNVSVSGLRIVPDFILQKVTNARKRGLKIVLVTGVFDLLHQEHVIFLAKAKSGGDLLIVAIESDMRVKKIKGNDRPIQGQADRLRAVESQKSVDLAFILPDEFSTPADHELLISLIRPNILAVSSHTAHLDKKRAVLEKYGAKVKIVHEHNPNISTTLVIEKKIASDME
ncbi:MAG: adenylyltransferase/cytidyltransferase family protein [Microgenomates group bacterium]